MIKKLLKKLIKKQIFSFIFLFSLSISLFSQEFTIDYYGIVADSLEANMAKMTSDLYFTQLCEIPSFSVIDRRITPSISEIPDTSLFSDERLSFYTEIKKNENTEAWTTTIHVYNKGTQTEYSKSKEYDSFYKILVESKQNLQASIKTLISNYSSDEDKLEQYEESFKKKSIKVSSEMLSGNWSGEEYIDKIVIMRGGRGFIIFKNGASMNISITINDTTITISQTGKTNASFFPELPRSLALNAALTAEPIKWILESKDQNTLIGQKNTLLPSNDTYESGTLDVTWKRIN